MMTPGIGVISGARITYEDATVDQVGAVGGDSQRADVEALLAEPGVDEAFVLRTCNRSEAYVVADDAATGRAALATLFAPVPDDLVVETAHEESLRHLMRVAAGLESMVLGEDRILGQFREAYQEAHAAGGIDVVLEEATTKAIHVGERVRTETGINEGVVSMASAAAAFLDGEVDLADSTAVVLGAGDIGTAAAKSLADRGVDELVVANRTLPNARALAEALEDDTDTAARAVGLADLPAAVARATVVVTATGSQDPLVSAGMLESTGETFVVDMGQPRDVDPDAGNLTNVEVHDLDALEAITDENRERRQAAADRAAEIIDHEFEVLLDQYKRKRADEVIAAMHESADQVKRREVETAVSKLEAAGDLTDEQREIVDSLADALVGQLLAAPTKSLRDAAAEDDWETIVTALQLFDPEFQPDPDSFVASVESEGDPMGPPAGVASSPEDDG